MNKPQEPVPTSTEHQFDRSVFGQYKAKVTPLAQQLVTRDDVRSRYIDCAGKLLWSFDLINENFPDKSILPMVTTATGTIYVLSLACGIPSEYLAFKILYPNARIHFIAIDIDAEHNKIVSATFANFPDFTLLTADGSDPIELLQLLKKHNIAPQGFSLIFLRQPDFSNKEHRPTFMRMINIIPLLAAANARLFISSYHEDESKYIRQLLNVRTPSTYQPIIAKEDGLKLKNVYDILFDDGLKLEPDSFIQFLDCKGTVLKFINRTDEIRILMTMHITKNSPIFLNWQFSDQSQALYVMDTNSALLDSIKTYLEQHQIHSIRCGKVKNSENFCLQILKADSQFAQLGQVSPLPADAFKLTPPAVATTTTSSPTKALSHLAELAMNSTSRGQDMRVMQIFVVLMCVGYAALRIMYEKNNTEAAQTSTTNTNTINEQLAESTTTTAPHPFGS